MSSRTMILGPRPDAVDRVTELPTVGIGKLDVIRYQLFVPSVSPHQYEPILTMSVF